MAKVVSEKQINNFVKGLITEASPLTFPENASIDEENFELLVNGSRQRRLGIDYETNYTLTATGIATGSLAAARCSVHYWPFPGGDSTVSLAVVRIFNDLYFINLLASSPSSAVLTSYKLANFFGNVDIQMAVVNGFLVIVPNTLFGPPIIFRWDRVNKISIASNPSYPGVDIRDFYGIYESAIVTSRPAGAAYTNISDVHNYNLQNQGWDYKQYTTSGAGIDPIRATWLATNPLTATAGLFPSNADIMSYGRIGATGAAAVYNSYDPLAMFRNSVDLAQAPKGHFIINYALRDSSRTSAASSLYAQAPLIPTDAESGIFTVVASYAGRVFYSGISPNLSGGDLNSPNYSGYIFFSQVVTGRDKLNKCYQENDPTSPDISDLLATDGGTIQIPEISKIYKLLPFGQSLLVFAENGVWEIFGDAGGFTATSYQVAKVNSIGIQGADSAVDASGRVLYWSGSGIYMLSPDPTSGRLTTQNITTGTIQTLYNNISGLAKTHTKVMFDEQSNTVMWLYNDSATYGESNYPNTYNKQLNLNLTLQAFSKYSFSTIDDTEFNIPRICGFVKLPNYATTIVDSPVVAGPDTVIAGSDSVVISEDLRAPREASSYRYLTMKGASFTLSELHDTTFTDWVTVDGTGANYSSYLVTGYEYTGDIMREKQVPYVLFYFDRTEDGFSTVGGNLVLDNPSSCLVQAQWNWTDSANSGKWGTQFQAYRLLRNYVPSGAGDPFDYGDSVIVTKNKLRGSGRVLSLKIQSEAGKDMKLLGWAMPITAKSEV